MRDKINIFGSPLGMYSLLRENYIISVLNDDGTLNETKARQMIKSIADMGANCIRDFFWIDSEEANKTISPFWVDGQNININQTFFENQRRIAGICNECNMTYYHSLFDHCGTKGDIGQFNPWAKYQDFFYDIDPLSLTSYDRYKYIGRILQCFDGLDIGYELCNEPKSGRASAVFQGKTLIQLLAAGVDPKKIILGIDYGLKENVPEYGETYREFREFISGDLSGEWRKLIKSYCISPIHGSTIDYIRNIFGDEPPSGGTRRLLISTDGVRPRMTFSEAKELSAYLLTSKKKSAERGGLSIEIVYGKTSDDPLDSIRGVSEAYREHFGQWPVNYRPNVIFSGHRVSVANGGAV